METNQLTFEHICFKYKGNDNQLFTDLDVTMETGQVVGILGASGSGKTTLTEILLGQLKPTCQQFRILEKWQTCDCWFTLLVLCAPTKSST